MNKKITSVIFSCVILAFAGCQQYKGAKVTEGTDLAIGLVVPVDSVPIKLDVLNWLSGFRLGVDQNAIMTCKYTTTENNSYLGVVKTNTKKTVDVTVEPCETSSTNVVSVAVK